MSFRTPHYFNVVIAGPDPATHSVAIALGPYVTEWMPGSSPGMTTVEASDGRRI